MSNVIPFPRKANTEPNIDSDYFGSELIPLELLFEALEREKLQQQEKTSSTWRKRQIKSEDSDK